MADNNLEVFPITPELARKLIAEQFPEFSHLAIKSVEKQGHDNRTYRLGNDILIRMPTAESYALKVPKEQKLLPKLAPYFQVRIPSPLKMGSPTHYYPFPFSIYAWLPGQSLNLLVLSEDMQLKLAFDLATFLKELKSIRTVVGPLPGQHNWWRGDHVSVYDQGAQKQMAQLHDVIDLEKAKALWEKACQTRWHKPPVWIHGDVAIGNILLKHDQLSAIIDWGGMTMGDPACDVVIAWTYFHGKSREIFIREVGLDEDTWLRARAWALWKATFELCQLHDKNSLDALVHRKIIEDVMS